MILYLFMLAYVAIVTALFIGAGLLPRLRVLFLTLGILGVLAAAAVTVAVVALLSYLTTHPIHMG